MAIKFNEPVMWDILLLMKSLNNEQKITIHKKHCPIVKIIGKKCFNRCPYCKYDCIYTNHKYCPNCGLKIEWNV